MSNRKYYDSIDTVEFLRDSSALRHCSLYVIAGWLSSATGRTREVWGSANSVAGWRKCTDMSIAHRGDAVVRTYGKRHMPECFYRRSQIVRGEWRDPLTFIHHLEFHCDDYSPARAALRLLATCRLCEKARKPYTGKWDRNLGGLFGLGDATDHRPRTWVYEICDECAARVSRLARKTEPATPEELLLSITEYSIRNRWLRAA